MTSGIVFLSSTIFKYLSLERYTKDKALGHGNLFCFPEGTILQIPAPLQSLVIGEPKIISVVATFAGWLS
jgi:hypothetical protein